MDRVSLKGYAKQFLKDHLLEAWGGHVHHEPHRWEI